MVLLLLLEAGRGLLMKPLMVELFAGLHGWGEGAVAEGFWCAGFDIVDMCREIGQPRPDGCDLVLQDVLTIHGSQFRDASLIVASPPCQEFSWMAMPWSRAKRVAAALRGDGEFPEGYRGSRTVADLTALFDACFRIQREACEAAGRHIPMVVENVRGAIPWVGRSRWNFGSFHLWGDVPALMPMTKGAVKNPGLNWSAHADPDYRTSGKGACFRDSAIKNNGGSWFNVAHNTTSGHSNNPRDTLAAELATNGGSWFGDYAAMKEGVKQGGDWFNADQPSIARMTSSKSNARKAASAMIARIPLPLARYIARVYRPQQVAA